MKELPNCPVESTLLLIGDKWKVLILRDLMEGTKRFGELRKSLGGESTLDESHTDESQQGKSFKGITQKVLTANLRSMEDCGLLTRKVYPVVPPKVEYTLTETGYSLKTVLDAMTLWGTQYKEKVEFENNKLKGVDNI